jgi:23S rRNA (pseudouridine1915-N3)-methyltransferase
MKILLAAISPRKGGLTGPAAELLADYIGRCLRYAPTSHQIFPTEAKLLAAVTSSTGRTQPILILTDSRGKQLSSEDLASTLSVFQDNGAQQITLAIGPANGWSAEALRQANLTIAFGRITLPHELAAVIAAEQIYRALTIRANHPYHSGH